MEWLQKVKQELLSHTQMKSLDDSQLKQLIENVMDSRLTFEKITLSYIEKEKYSSFLFSQLRGYGVLDELLADDTITEIMVNRYDLIFIERYGVLEHSHCVFDSVEQLYDVIQKIVNQTGREVNFANPIVDTRLQDGSRVNIVLSPISLNGPVMTIRKFSKKTMTMFDLERSGMLDSHSHQLLKNAVINKQNILISGGTGTGKTTFLNALSQHIPENERLITIEDSAELQLIDKPNLIALETRNANSAKVGQLSIRDLIKTALRMRPERIIVGEVRGIEAIDMLQAMNTGHAGSLSTIHANSTKDVIARLETMVIMTTDNIPLLAIRQQIASSIQLIVHLVRTPEGKRVVETISSVEGCVNEQIVLKHLFERGKESHA